MVLERTCNKNRRLNQTFPPPPHTHGGGGGTSLRLILPPPPPRYPEVGGVEPGEWWSVRIKNEPTPSVGSWFTLHFSALSENEWASAASPSRKLYNLFFREFTFHRIRTDHLVSINQLEVDEILNKLSAMLAPDKRAQGEAPPGRRAITAQCNSSCKKNSSNPGDWVLHPVIMGKT